MRRLFFYFSVFFLNPVLVFANENLDISKESTDAINLTQGTTSIGLLLVRYVFAVIFVVSLLYFTLKFIIKKNDIKYSEGNWVNVLDYNHLGNNKGLYLVEINKEGYVLAASENNMEFLTKIGAEEFNGIKNDLIVRKDFNEFTFNPFKLKEKESFQNHLRKNIKIAEKYFNKKRD